MERDLLGLAEACATLPPDELFDRVEEALRDVLLPAGSTAERVLAKVRRHEEELGSPLLPVARRELAEDLRALHGLLAVGEAEGLSADGG